MSSKNRKKPATRRESACCGSSYTVAVRDSDNMIIYQKKVSSSYYRYDMPDRIDITVDFPFEKGQFSVEITANGFWFAKSDKFIYSFTV